ncbi:MAG TPA: YegS/Rv2252/BmrU family lipid kinase [Phycisphaerae bacterium]|nr:YegS/Rv2252/BmrU family lipid kinase [Phycisphaerae bacterium]HRW52315.1 YegS/Rv2252/BmrU family lipid kinase [Phycisphaerae bacterium]
MRTTVIYNDNAGGAGSQPEFIHQCEARDDCALKPTRKPGDARRLAAGAVAEGAERIIVAGGDGTINEVLNGVLAAEAEAPPELGVLPMGTGNDFARCLDIPLDNLDAALDIALNRPARHVDLGVLRAEPSANGGAESPTAPRYFLNMAYSAFGGIGGAADADSKKRWGALTYWATAISKALDQPEHHVELQLDDRPLSVAAHGVIVANGRYVGGGVQVTPDALLDDRRFDVLILPVQPLADTLLAGIDIVRGLSVESDRVIVARASRVRIAARPQFGFSVDGESCCSCDPSFDIEPRRVRVACGAAPEGFGGA